MNVAAQSAAVQRTLKNIGRLEELAAEVLLLQADVSDEEQMRHVLDRVYADFGRLDGVIHAAGLSTSELLRPIQETDPQYCTKHFLPKAQGTAALSKMLRDRETDFVVLFSSLASVIGGLGMCSYAAANTYLDASAVANNRLAGATRWLSINWDGFNISDQQDDHGVDSALLDASKGVAALDAALSVSGEPQILISATDLEQRLSQWIFREDEAEQAGQQNEAQNVYPRPSLQTEYVAATDDIERKLVEIWESLLGIAPIGTRDNFFELGGHSLLMTQLVSRLRLALHLTIPLRSLVELPTIEQLAQSIRRMNAPESKETRESHLVEIQRGTTDLPLFCVHPLGGGVSVFLDLARQLGADQPFYAFQAMDVQTLSELGIIHSSLEDMANDYLRELLSVQPKGPYCLGGLSLGGQIAFEMAQQLVARGEKIAFLCMFDTFAPNPHAPIPDDDELLVGFARELAASAGKDIAMTLDDLNRDGRESKITEVLNRLKRENLIAPNTSPSAVEAFLKESARESGSVKIIRRGFTPGSSRFSAPPKSALISSPGWMSMTKPTDGANSPRASRP